jgi:hypothetical protein
MRGVQQAADVVQDATHTATKVWSSSAGDDQTLTLIHQENFWLLSPIIVCQSRPIASGEGLILEEKTT